MVAVTMVKELGPVLSALMVAGSVGSAITAEIGTMVVTEQVDAMRVEGTDIVKRLVSSRLKAMLIACRFSRSLPMPLRWPADTSWRPVTI